MRFCSAQDLSRGDLVIRRCRTPSRRAFEDPVSTGASSVSNELVRPRPDRGRAVGDRVHGLTRKTPSNIRANGRFEGRGNSGNRGLSGGCRQASPLRRSPSGTDSRTDLSNATARGSLQQGGHGVPCRRSLASASPAAGLFGCLLGRRPVRCREWSSCSSRTRLCCAPAVACAFYRHTSGTSTEPSYLAFGTVAQRINVERNA